MKLHRFFSLFLLLAGAAALHAEPLRIAVASNFLSPAKALAARFESETGLPVTLSAGSTGKLYAQIIHGAPYDLFLAANSREPERLQDEGLVVDGSRFTYALGQLVLWSPDETTDLSRGGESWLQQAGYERLSLANPKTAPYGAAAVNVLRKLGIDKASRRRLVFGENVSQTYQFAASGNVDAGFVALSQVRARPGGSYWVIPTGYYPPIRQQAVWLKRSQHERAAERFLAWFRSPEATDLIEKFGYQVEHGADG